MSRIGSCELGYGPAIFSCDLIANQETMKRKWLGVAPLFLPADLLVHEGLGDEV